MVIPDTSEMFQPCEICGSDSWELAYAGPVRAGAFGTKIPDAKVSLCGGCGVARLGEEFCIDARAYESEEYRAAVSQGLTTADFFRNADPSQILNLGAFWPLPLRGAVVADIGCGAGSFLDHVAGLASGIVAVEPTVLYRESLRERGYDVYSYTADAFPAWSGRVDLAVTFQVIEHVRNPREFLSEIAVLLKPGGLLLIATLNRNDILITLLPDDFPAFFYRSVHRWYFDRASLRRCLNLVGGFEVDAERFVHSYGMSNALSWMKERRPTGHLRRPGIDRAADAAWSGYLEATGQADNLYLLARKSE